MANPLRSVAGEEVEGEQLRRDLLGRESLLRSLFGSVRDRGRYGPPAERLHKGRRRRAGRGAATGASGGESYRDPFAPDFWSSEVASPENSEASAETRSAFSPQAGSAEATADARPAAPATPEPAPAPAPAAPEKSELERKLEALTGVGGTRPRPAACS